MLQRRLGSFIEANYSSPQNSVCFHNYFKEPRTNKTVVLTSIAITDRYHSRKIDSLFALLALLFEEIIGDAGIRLLISRDKRTAVLKRTYPE
jgi:hypothetical protein